MSKQKKYHYIYKTTCQITGKFYVGMHSTDNIDDGYFGSGKILGYSISKHGIENHKVEIIEFLETREALKLRELEIVNEELLSNPLNINLKYGGEGGWDHITSEQQSENGRRGNAKMKILRQTNPEWVRAHSVAQSAALIGNSAGWSKLTSEASRTPAACEKRRNTMAKNKHSQGERNSQFGTCWVTNGTPVKIKIEQLQEFLDRGFIRGRKYA